MSEEGGLTLEAIVKSYIERFGEPRMIVVSRPQHFLLQELVHGSDILAISIPEDLWPRERVYLENVMTSMRANIG